MDERFPTLPMLKWDHMMSSPPMFCHVLPGSPCSSGAPCGSSAGGSTKLLLGSHSSQEVTVLQYSGQSTGGVLPGGPAFDTTSTGLSLTAVRCVADRWRCRGLPQPGPSSGSAQTPAQPQTPPSATPSPLPNSQGQAVVARRRYQLQGAPSWFLRVRVKLGTEWLVLSGQATVAHWQVCVAEGGG